MFSQHLQIGVNVVRSAICRSILFALLGLSSAPILAHTNPIQEENAKPGTVKWQISDAANAGEIEGYASAVSVAPGGTIDLFVNTTDPTYSISIYRLGWYGGLGGRLMAGPIELNRQLQPAPNFDPVTRLVECNWNKSYSLAIPNSIASPWVSGIYVAKLTGSSGKQSHIMFVVRDDVRSTDILFQSSVTTFAAYNAWGGSSLYDYYPPGAGPAAVKVSFNRPYQSNNGTAEFMTWEYRMVRFMEREGFDVSYSTNIDTHTSGERLLNHRAFLSVGHDEYWTREMYDNIENARKKTVNLGFFGANTAFWQIRLEPSATGNANRTVVGYRYKTPYEDPLFPGPLSTLQWRDPIVSRPEAALVGVMYESNSYIGDIVIKDCPGWLCKGTTIQPGDTLKGVLGYEQDRLDASSPVSIIVIGASPYLNASGPACCAHMTYYTAASGAGVFATGSMSWNWGLDTLGGPQIGADTQAKVQQITRNVLQKFSMRYPPIPTYPPSVTLTAPTSGTTIELGSSIMLTATATDSDGQVAKVAFYDDGVLLGVDLSAPFSFYWENPAVGEHVLTAKAFDNAGARTTSSAVNITVQCKKIGARKAEFCRRLVAQGGM
ncbi:MAG: Ig-like domain-containing protein [Gammaproteobacteria bacterium]